MMKKDWGIRTACTLVGFLCLTVALAFATSLVSAKPLVLVSVECPGQPSHVEQRASVQLEIRGDCFEQVMAVFDPSLRPGDIALVERDFESLIRIQEKPGWPRTFNDFGGAPLTLAEFGDSRGMTTVFRDAEGVIHALAPDGESLSGWPVPLSETSGGGALAAGDLLHDGRDELVLTRGPLIVLSSRGRILPGWPFSDGGFLGSVPVVARFTPYAPLRVVSAGGLDPVPPLPRSEGGAFVLDDRGRLLDGWPAVIPKGKFSAPLPRGPAVGDVTGDGIAEVVATVLNESAVWVFDEGGRLVNGFPFTDGVLMDSPSLGDLDTDGAQEIVFWMGTLSRKPAVMALSGDGIVRPGWPQITNAIGNGGPALGDVDGDGRLEILACTVGGITPGGLIEGGVYLWNDDGTALPGWPKLIPFTGFPNPPIIADVDGDGVGDIVVTGATAILPSDGVIYAWRTNGQLIPGFPIVIDRRPIFGTAVATVADIDGDGIAELGVTSDAGAFASRPNRVHWFDLGVPYRPEGMEWPTWAHDMGRTSSYSPPVRIVEATVKIQPPLLPAATPMPPLQVVLSIPRGEREPPGEMRLVAVDGEPVEPITGKKATLVGNRSAAVQVYRFPGDQVRAALPGPGHHQLTFESLVFGQLRGIQYRATGEIEVAQIP